MRALPMTWHAEEFERRYRASKNTVAVRCYHALRPCATGTSVRAATVMVGATPETPRT